MTRDQIRATLIHVLEEDTGESFGGIDDAKKLREEMGLDSVDIVSLIMQVERKFRIRLAPEDLENVVTVGQMLDLVESKAGKAAQLAAA